MNKPDMYMPLIIGDFLKETTRLDTEQQGAYLLLLLEFWTKGPLPTDEKILQKVTNFSAHKWAKKSADILEIFEEENGRLVHRGMARERARVIARHEALSKAGRNGNEKKWSRGDTGGDSKSASTDAATRSHSDSDSENTYNSSLSRAETFKDPEPEAPAPGGRVDGSGNYHEADMIALLLANPFEIEIDVPTAARWVEQGFRASQADELGRIARQRKPTGPIPVKYLQTIIEGEFINPEKNTRSNRHADRTSPAAKLSPAEIVAEALRAEATAATGIFDGHAELIH